MTEEAGNLLLAFFVSERFWEKPKNAFLLYIDYCDIFAIQLKDCYK